MDFMETPEEIAGQLELARKRLKEFEEETESSVLLGRLRASNPFHLALVARVVTLLVMALGIVAAIGLLSLPWAIDPLPLWFTSLEDAFEFPLPLLAAVFSCLMAFAYFGAGQAALAFARECPLMPHEQREHDRLLNEVKRLSSQKAIMDRVRATPMGARPRTSTPVGQRSATSPLASSASNALISAVTPMPRTLTEAARGSGGRVAQTPPRMDLPPLGRNTTPLGATQRSGADSSIKRRGASSFTPSPAQARETPRYAPPTPRPEARATAPASQVTERSVVRAVERAAKLEKEHARTERSVTNVPTDPPEEVTDKTRRSFNVDAAPREYDAGQPALSSTSRNGGFEQRYATHFPKWGPVDEPWLEDAIQKSEALATGFPVQAHLQFSAEAHLPFTLILERATPAMAVRAMVSYVEFLASIATPPRARIALRSVPHLDRSFHRNVDAALEPYFSGRFRVIRETDRIEIEFEAWDEAWNDFPYLPLDSGE